MATSKKTILSEDDVKHVAKLANLPVEEKEKKLFSQQLTKILDFVDNISQVRTEKTIPLTNVLGEKNVFRKDEVKPSLTQKQALENSSSTYQGYFKVDSVFGEDE